ncbi:preprotein translocase subunit SecY [Staphylococcus microti]|uniref:Accessory Sec system protein translocase subunit SecY2 n=1 Tax=Staphylococcus microti TaxID=569857 RepID=A0ABR5C6T1_9STAP|nr:accessory Sec system protein translocase subunit SecY2 [Staphylococcus microti]KIX90251.1 preprotein translocase subunit SecY [Staphylococcus microti]PNZ82150.1 accessory Sec system protein translocase subunit SecY2 [Staphylococcus microti]
MNRILRQYEYKVLYKRCAFTFLILFIYILGSRITIVDPSHMIVKDKSFYQLAVSNVGGDIQTLNLFSLGLGPWLTALIFLMLVRYRDVEKSAQLTRREKHYQEKLLALMLSVVQGYFVIYQYVSVQQREHTNIWLMLLILVAGTMLLIWLADQNVRYGIAGAMPIVLMSIIRSIFHQQLPDVAIDGWLLTLIVVLIGVTLVILLFMEFVEYRLHYRDIMQVDQSRAQTFVAWKINPAGSISIMISLSVFILLNSLLNMIFNFLPDLSVDLDVLQLSHPVGVTVYILLQVTLGYALSRLLIHTKQTSKTFLKSGNYFEKIQPGPETNRYLNHKARLVCWTGAGIVGVIIGVPMYLSLLVPQLSQQIYFAIQLMIVMYISINIAETVRTYLYFDKYQQFLTKYW